MYDSALSGQAWLQELLNGHPVRFHNNIGMSKHVFRKLVHELQMYAGLEDTKHVTKEEQLAIFLHQCQTGAASRDVQERFQHGPKTISKCAVITLFLILLWRVSIRVFSHLLEMVVSKQFYNHHVKLSMDDKTPPKIRYNPKLYPFFHDYCGAVNGTHINAFVPMMPLHVIAIKRVA